MAGSILLKDKQAMILVSLKEGKQPWYISTLAKACNATYVHTSNFINVCEKLGIVTSEKHGKTKEIKLTEKGAKLAEMLSGIYAIINQPSGTGTVPAPKAAEQPKAAPAEEKK